MNQSLNSLCQIAIKRIDEMLSVLFLYVHIKGHKWGTKLAFCYLTASAHFAPYLLCNNAKFDT